MMDEIAFHGTLSEDVVKRALDSRRSRGMKVFAWFFVAMMLLGGVIVPLVNGSHDPRQYAWPCVMIIAIAGYQLFANRFFARQALTKNKLRASTLRGTISVDAVSTISDYGSSRIPWNKYYSARVLPDLVILHQSPGSMQILPREFFGSDSEWQQVQTWARELAPVPSQKSSIVRSLIIWFVVALLVVLLWNLYRAGG